MLVARAFFDELGWASCRCPNRVAELLFEVFSQRYERGSTLVTKGRQRSFGRQNPVFAVHRLPAFRLLLISRSSGRGYKVEAIIYRVP
jgi:hypothetical protein